MSTYVWMRLLESASERYDIGIRLLSLGHINRVYDRVGQLARGPDVLDLGCGTGTLALLLAQRGFRVTGVDLSADMLARAREKTATHPALRWVQAGALELTDHFPAESFDTITSVLLLSELSAAEQREALRQCHHLLRRPGQLIVADEVPAPTRARRIFHQLLRLPLAAVTYVLTQASTHPVRELEAKLAQAHFTPRRQERNHLGDFVVLEAEKQEVRDGAPA